MSIALIVEAAFLALLPAVLYAILVWWLDRHEKEPFQLMVVAFAWGAVPAILLAIVLSLLLQTPLEGLVSSEGMFRVAQAGLIAPIVEEAVKAIILVVMFLAFRREYDNVLDGIVYGALVGLGFSFVENVLYLASEGASTGTDGMVRLWVLRAGVFGLNHSMFTAFTGAALGFARSVRGGPTRALVAATGLGVAMIMHGLHNVLVTAPAALSSGPESENLIAAACLGAVLSDWGGVLLLLVLGIVSSVREGRLIREELVEEMALGRITPGEYEMLGSGGKRWRARWSALFSGGFGRWRRLGRFIELSTELAFRKHRRYEGDPRHQDANAREVERLRWQIDYSRGAR